MEAPVLFETRQSQNGALLGIATLNAPHLLNGLSLQMVDLLATQLTAWAEDPQIAVVILRGAGEKAFCAGGDLHGLYASMTANTSGDPWANDVAKTFFEREYRLDYYIHHYPKPLLCWGHGIVMGGGVGLMMGASHRVVTEASRVAMPEIGIGLFPDVGGSWLLSRLPGRLGLFLALTGAQLNTSDALYAGLADYFVAQERYQDVLDGMLHSPWEVAAEDPSHPPRAMNDGILTRLLQQFSQVPEEEGPLARHTFLLNNACSGNDLTEIAEEIGHLADNADPWLAKAAQGFRNGAPGSARLSFLLQQRARMMSLADVFRMEYVAALAAAAHGDFQEGIRALLIDKDRTPRWNPDTLDAADNAWAERFFIAPWPQQHEHPLHDLGMPQ